MAGYYTESNYENAVLQLLNEGLGYTYVYGPDVERDYHSPLYEDVLLPALQRINKGLPQDAINEAIYKLKNFESGSLLQKNMTFTDYLQNGITVKYAVKGEERSSVVKLIDYAEKNIGKEIFITPDEAMKQVTPKTLLIIVDTHLRNSLESPQLYDECKKVIVIDHHRRAVNYIDNALVFCHEPFASSACEMCSEIISCIDDKAIGYAQADALLAGIMLDTKNFVLKTGVRTFEAAAYLRRRGATTINVKQMFSDSIETYREKVSIVCDAKIYRNCAISIAKGADGDVRLASAQAADELLTLENVKASFVIYESGGKICISARSFGAVNVQIIMEKLGGGGHQTMSATQLSDINKEQALKMLIEVIDTNLEDASCK